MSKETLAALREVQDQVFAVSKEAGVRFMFCVISRDGLSTDEISRHLRQSGFDRREELVEFVLDLRRWEAQRSEPLAT